MYNIQNFNCSRGQTNCQFSSAAPAIHTYISSDDMSVIVTPGYFPVRFGFDPEDVLTFDYIFIQANDGNLVVIVEQVNPVIVEVYIPNSEQSVGLISTTASGPYTAPIPVDITFVKIYSQVTLRFVLAPGQVAAHTAVISLGSGILVAHGIEPSVNTTAIMTVLNTTYQPGLLTLQNNGDVSVSLFGDQFPSGNNVGYPIQDVSYTAS